MRNPFSIERTQTAAFERIQGSFLPQISQRNRRLKAVVIGGGTGAPVSIKTLLSMGIETSAIVAMADDGGSTGILREEAHVTPPGDIRKCLVAFARDSHDPMTHAFRYRFEFARNHTLGNLMLSALEEATGSFPKAIQICEDLLQCRGHVYPSTLDNIILCAHTRDGRDIEGQAKACHSQTALERVWLKETQVDAYEPAVRAIMEADLIVLGPGSLFTSIIPNLLVPGILEALRSTRAHSVFVCSLADMQGETWGLSAEEHVNALLDHGMRGLLDYVLIHTPHPLKTQTSMADMVDAASEHPSESPGEHEEMSLNPRIRPVRIDHTMARRIQNEGPVVIARNLVDPLRPTWHNPEALREAFAGVIKLCRSRQK